MPRLEAIGDVLRLLAGHWKRRRHAGLQNIAGRLYATPGVGAYAARTTVNATLRFRRFVHVYAVLRCVRLISRRRYARAAAQAAAAGEIAPPALSMSLLCPTRGRVAHAKAFVNSVIATAARPERLEILFYVDDDDQDADRYVWWIDQINRTGRSVVRCRVLVGAPLPVSQSWNILAAACTGDLLLMANDDQMYVDYAWDVRLDRECLRWPDGIGCWYFDHTRYEGTRLDLFPRGDFPIVTRRWYEILGYFTPGIFEFSGNDVWILDVARRVGRLHPIPGVFVEHLHYDAYKSAFDETYQRHRLTRAEGIRDLSRYLETTRDRGRAVEKLRQAIDRPRAPGAARQPQPEAWTTAAPS